MNRRTFTIRWHRMTTNGRAISRARVFTSEKYAHRFLDKLRENPAAKSITYADSDSDLIASVGALSMQLTPSAVESPDARQMVFRASPAVVMALEEYKAATGREYSQASTINLALLEWLTLQRFFEASPDREQEYHAWQSLVDPDMYIEGFDLDSQRERAVGWLERIDAAIARRNTAF